MVSTNFYAPVMTSGVTLLAHVHASLIGPGGPLEAEWGTLKRLIEPKKTTPEAVFNQWGMPFVLPQGQVGTPSAEQIMDAQGFCAWGYHRKAFAGFHGIVEVCDEMALGMLAAHKAGKAYDGDGIVRRFEEALAYASPKSQDVASAAVDMCETMKPRIETLILQLEKDTESKVSHSEPLPVVVTGDAHSTRMKPSFDIMAGRDYFLDVLQMEPLCSSLRAFAEAAGIPGPVKEITSQMNAPQYAMLAAGACPEIQAYIKPSASRADDTRLKDQDPKNPYAVRIDKALQGRFVDAPGAIPKKGQLVRMPQAGPERDIVAAMVAMSVIEGIFDSAYRDNAVEFGRKRLGFVDAIERTGICKESDMSAKQLVDEACNKALSHLDLWRSIGRG